MCIRDRYDITDITNPQTIYKDRTCMNRAGNCCTVCIQLQNITGSKDKDILFRNTKIFYDMFLCSQMSVFTMNRNRIFWSYQRIDQMCIRDRSTVSLKCISQRLKIMKREFQRQGRISEEPAVSRRLPFWKETQGKF